MTKTTGETTSSELLRLFDLQKAAFAADRFPSLEERLDRLAKLESLVKSYREAFQVSVAADFGSHHPFVTDLWETGAILGRIRHIRANLASWIAPDARALDAGAHGGSEAHVLYQPKGVIGNIAPWNFPVESAMIMVADMLAGGNRVIVKSSELAPETAAVLRRAVAEHFDEDLVAVVFGGPELGGQFAALEWDHLCFTGSTRVGRIVMEAAAKNLVPVTLELGGKNPTVFGEDGITQELVERFVYFRAFKAGQVCTVPDYVMVPEGRVEEWVELAKKAWCSFYPDGWVGHADATGIINGDHFRRVMGYVEEAREAGVEVVSLNGDEPDAERRQVPMYVVVDPPENLSVMQDEIFGPVTAVVPYRDLDDAIDRINRRPAPLGSYLVTQDRDAIERFERDVKSGGVGVNVFGFWGAQHNMPFGGIGHSGTGCHSGHEGFLNFTHAKSVFRATDDNAVMHAIRPPYAESATALADSIFAA